MTNTLLKLNQAIIKCKKCQLIQLKHNFNRGKMFGRNYGYESGINKSMKNHLRGI